MNSTKIEAPRAYHPNSPLNDNYCLKKVGVDKGMKLC